MNFGNFDLDKEPIPPMEGSTGRNVMNIPMDLDNDTQVDKFESNFDYNKLGDTLNSFMGSTIPNLYNTFNKDARQSNLTALQYQAEISRNQAIGRGATAEPAKNKTGLILGVVGVVLVVGILIVVLTKKKA